MSGGTKLKSAKIMKKETDMFHNDERQQARRQRQGKRLIAQRNRRAVISALSQPATNANERRARRNAIDSLSREQIESTAGRLNANQYTLLNQEQQKWYTEATNARNANRQTNSQPQSTERNSKTYLTDKETSAVEKVTARINTLRDQIKSNASKMSLSQINRNRSEYQRELDRLIKFAERKGYNTPKQSGVIDYSTIKPSLGAFLGVKFTE